METLPLTRHAHDAVFYTDDWKKNKVMMDFFTVVGLDDGLA